MDFSILLFLKSWSRRGWIRGMASLSRNGRIDPLRAKQKASSWEGWRFGSLGQVWSDKVANRDFIEKWQVLWTSSSVVGFSFRSHPIRQISSLFHRDVTIEPPPLGTSPNNPQALEITGLSGRFGLFLLGVLQDERV